MDQGLIVQAAVVGKITVLSFCTNRDQSPLFTATRYLLAVVKKHEARACIVSDNFGMCQNFIIILSRRKNMELKILF